MASWPKPECLFVPDSNNKLQLNHAAVSKLQAVNEPLIIITVTGLYRTGKSFIMNKIAQKSEGFAVSASSELVTKGVWVWLIKNPIPGKQKILLLDTHGLGDPETNDSEYDKHILCLSSLLSSILIYNYKGEIDVTAIEQLQFVNKLRQCINTRESRISLPEFILLVRDAQFDEQITDSYMEKKMFTTSKGYPQAHNNLIASFKDCFCKRKCFTLPLPASSKLLCSPQLYDNLDSDFKEEFDRFYRYITTNAKCKMINGSETVNGKRFTRLAQLYVNQVNNKSDVRAYDVVEIIVSDENKNAYDNAVRIYDRSMNNKSISDSDLKRWLTCYKECTLRAAKNFLSNAMNEKNNLHSELLIYFQHSSVEFLKKYVASTFNDDTTQQFRSRLLVKDGQMLSLRDIEAIFYNERSKYSDRKISQLLEDARHACTALEDTGKQLKKAFLDDQQKRPIQSDAGVHFSRSSARVRPESNEQFYTERVVIQIFFDLGNVESWATTEWMITAVNSTKKWIYDAVARIYAALRRFTTEAYNVTVRQF